MAVAPARSAARRRGAGRRLTAAALLAALAVMATDPGVAGGSAALTGLDRVSLDVALEHPVDGIEAGHLVARLDGALRGATPPMTITDNASDRIRLTVDVRPISATTLRGFWLPFSGTYGIGALRLGVDRTVTLPAAPGPFSAVVWQIERLIAGPWRATDVEIARSVDEMVAELLAELLEARRQAR